MQYYMNLYDKEKLRTSNNLELIEFLIKSNLSRN